MNDGRTDGHIEAFTISLSAFFFFKKKRGERYSPFGLGQSSLCHKHKPFLCSVTGLYFDAFNVLMKPQAEK